MREFARGLLIGFLGALLIVLFLLLLYMGYSNFPK